MRKIFLITCCLGLMFAALTYSPHVDATDTWIYTDSNGTKYFLRDYGIAARSWCFATVVKVDRNDNATHLVYRLDSAGMGYYSVYLGTRPYDVFSRDARCIEKGKISGNVVASIIWNDYVAPIDNERWARIRANEGR